MSAKGTKRKASDAETKDEPAAKKQKRNPVVAARVKLINGQFKVPEFNANATKIREAIQEAAEKVAAVVEGAEKHDVGRLIHALDLMQHAKDTACVSLMLPFAGTDAEGAT